jgi:predicted permease
VTVRLLFFFGLFYGSLAVGLGLRQNRAWAPPIMRWTILLVEPWLFLYSLWVVDLRQLPLYAPIPLLAVILILLIIVTTPWLARRLLPRPESQGSFVLAAAFSNIGTTGGAFLCYLLFGQPGLSLAYLFLLPYPFLVFTLGFSVAKRYAAGRRLALSEYLRATLTDPLSALPLLAMTAGALLNAWGPRPPLGAAPVIDVLIKLDLISMCLAIGMTLEWPDFSALGRPLTANAAIKFILSPACALLLVWGWYGSFLSLPAKILVIQAAMPSAIYAVIITNLFGLDRKLVNALWISSTLLLAPVAALLFWFFG